MKTIALLEIACSFRSLLPPHAASESYQENILIRLIYNFFIHTLLEVVQILYTFAIF